ncbi:hypothetical protein LBMAG52_00010 [Planctomycetia bacterium]|nr:hypothetical protein LBMAG52_00010 [Planctomycetia bacterium]
MARTETTRGRVVLKANPEQSQRDLARPKKTHREIAPHQPEASASANVPPTRYKYTDIRIPKMSRWALAPVPAI